MVLYIKQITYVNVACVKTVIYLFF